MESPSVLRPGGAGESLWAWLHTQCSGVDESRPLVIELCQVADTLELIRQRLGSQGLSVSGSRGKPAVNPLVAAEMKASRQFSVLWKLLGLSDRPEEERRPVGRPPGGFSP